MDDLRGVLDAAGCDRAAIFGISEGGPMSALFAATHPDRVSSLVLYGTDARMLEASDYPFGITAARLETLTERVEREWGGPVGLDGARLVELDGADHLAFVGDRAALLDEVEEFLVGSRRAHGVDRALATVLFTDIVGSTETASRLGDRRWRDLLERHDATVRRELAVHRGREVKTMGDGFLATFDGPARAIRCAGSIRDGLEQIGITVRAGIHTGEVEAIGPDVGGMAVNIGARVGALAEAGEVLFSSTVKELVVGSGIEFSERGAHRLRGAPDEWQLYAVEAASAGGD
jgi:class 3 adenylate cyclase